MSFCMSQGSGNFTFKNACLSTFSFDLAQNGLDSRMRDRVAVLGCQTLYRDRLKGVQILLSRTQAGPGKPVKQEQEETSPNHVQAF